MASAKAAPPFAKAGAVYIPPADDTQDPTYAVVVRVAHKLPKGTSPDEDSYGAGHFWLGRPDQMESDHTKTRAKHGRGWCYFSFTYKSDQDPEATNSTIFPPAGKRLTIGYEASHRQVAASTITVQTSSMPEAPSDLARRLGCRTD